MTFHIDCRICDCNHLVVSIHILRIGWRRVFFSLFSFSTLFIVNLCTDLPFRLPFRLPKYTQRFVRCSPCHTWQFFLICFKCAYWHIRINNIGVFIKFNSRLHCYVTTHQAIRIPAFICTNAIFDDKHLCDCIIIKCIYMIGAYAQDKYPFCGPLDSFFHNNITTIIIIIIISRNNSKTSMRIILLIHFRQRIVQCCTYVCIYVPVLYMDAFTLSLFSSMNEYPNDCKCTI